MSWAIWLAVPVAATVLTAVLTWRPAQRARLRGRPDPDESMRAYRDYLAALAVPARGPHRVAPRAETD